MKKQKQVWWCVTHKREATYVWNKPGFAIHGKHTCDPELGGIMIPCECKLISINSIPTMKKPFFHTAMRFVNESWTYDQVKWPKLALPKYNGVCTLKVNGRGLTREMKLIPNLELRTIVEERFPEGAHAEFHTHAPFANFHDIQSVFMSRDGDLNKLDWCFRFFDIYVPQFMFMGYGQRMVRLYNLIKQLDIPEVFMITDATIVENQFHVERVMAVALNMGCEGLVLRDPVGKYKQGRATIAENTAFKLVHYLFGEGVMVGTTTTSSVVKTDQIGAITLNTKQWGRVDIGSGFDTNMSRDIKANPVKYVGRMAQFKYKPDSTKDKPCQPVFVKWLT